ncbi:MAG: S-methyl-5-thioribose-1-phosphate isomerase [Elusimicrobia bacterium]|nr:S-methyl-5-thioribose-1-phosphate isomerase [Elusimicrobiota bacterium]
MKRFLKGVGGGPVFFKKNALFLLDQRKIPREEKYIRVKTAKETAAAIRKMVVRGAPAIGVAAAYGMALGRGNITLAADVLLKSRPTAVNLKWAVDRMLAINTDNFGKLLKEAEKIEKENKVLCEKISKNGAKLIKKNSVVMTHCNAGALATGGTGTALGVLYAAKKKIKLVIVKETRPRLQGANLTTYELKKWKMPYILISDTASAFAMKKYNVSAIIVGADRIASNGDTANKIGTYALAIEARYHRIPFYVAAPYSTIDFGIKSGKKIVIEERNQDEVLKINGKPIAVAGTKAFNPAFDVTPAKLISAIITERGFIKNPDRKKMEQLYG